MLCESVSAPLWRFPTLRRVPVVVPARDIQRRAETACLLTHFLPIHVKQSSDSVVTIRTVFDEQIAENEHVKWRGEAFSGRQT
jgi:hypothetical protein